jgi:uncharacterized protein
MKWRYLILALFALLVTSLVYVFAQARLVTVKIKTAERTIEWQAEVAETAEDKAFGLMFRKKMFYNRAMLFTYEAPQPLKFWMKNMYMPIDMIFFDSDKKVNYIAKDVPPCLKDTVCPVYGPDVPARYVLEIRAGLAESFRIKIGDLLVF